MYHAKTLKAWAETPGLAGASGARCEFVTGDLKGLFALIENNYDGQRKLNTGVHLYSREYQQRDRAFAAAIQTDEARAR